MSSENNKSTCFNEHKKCNVSCKIKDCRYWHDLSGKNNNCFINKINDQKNNITLEEIGNIFGITRMRVCQIEKSVLSKIKKNLIF